MPTALASTQANALAGGTAGSLASGGSSPVTTVHKVSTTLCATTAVNAATPPE